MILICGYPRAGKTTYSQRYKDVIHLDTTMGWRGSRYKGVYREIEKRSDAVVEGIFGRSKERTDLLEAYKGNGRKVCIWLDTPLEVRQTREGYIKHGDYFEPPTKEEGWDEIVRITNETASV